MWSTWSWLAGVVEPGTLAAEAEAADFALVLRVLLRVLPSL
jgi:hypothetical protein